MTFFSVFLPFFEIHLKPNSQIQYKTDIKATRSYSAKTLLSFVTLFVLLEARSTLTEALQNAGYAHVCVYECECERSSDHE